ncbi:ArnT family glycosyltransferase [Zavarzinia sp. CC-PAN008]|uniref:ArnT family glycosyltransferase n=1 Tax=Zavarzinia sp. CC-PAN008 TaxID=3243332 RepID=UPI003F74ACA7
MAPSHSGVPRGIVPLLLVLAALAGLRLAALAASPLGLQVDEAQYWLWSQSFQFGYFSKPPLIAWAIGLSTAACGDAPWCVRLPSVIAHAIGPVFVFLFAYNLVRHPGRPRDLVAEVTALAAAVLYATLPGIGFSAVLISTDALLLPSWAAALWCYERALATGARRWWVGLGLALGLGMLAKYAMAYFVLGIAVHWLLERGRPERPRIDRGGLALALGLGVLVFAPNLAWNAMHAFLSFRHTADNMNLGGQLFRPGAMLEFLGSQFGVFGPITMAGAILVLAARRTWTRPEYRLLAAFSLPLLVLVTGQALLSRANANWAAPAYVGLAVLVAVAWLERGRLKLLLGTLGLHTALMLVLLVAIGLGRVPFLPLGAATDPMKALRGWDNLAVEVAAALDAHPGAIVLTDEREMLVELAYELRDRVRQDGTLVLAKWNLDGRIDDQFDLISDVKPHVGRDAILVTRGPDPQVIARHFASTNPLGSVAARGYEDRRGTFYLFALRRFDGY